jgi:type VI secretion system protein
MSSVRLRERLLYAANPRLMAGQSPDTLGRKSIMDHLTRLLNTRKGSVPIDPNYGLSDLSNIAGSFAVGTTEAICAEVAIQIEQYEPRLTQPKVMVDRSKNEREVISLRFEVSARLTDNLGKASDESLLLTMKINSHGYVSLEPNQGG